VKLVQMPTALLHVGDADLDRAGVDPGLLAAFRAYLPHALTERRGFLILAASEDGGHHLLMVLARRIGAALRDANIHLRDSGADLRAGRQALSYLTGPAMVAALAAPDARQSLASVAASFVQDLEGAWPSEIGAPASTDRRALRSLLDKRLAGGRPTFVQAAPGGLPRDVEAALRSRLPVLESARLASALQPSIDWVRKTEYRGARADPFTR
jgi:hypothetical protein